MNTQDITEGGVSTSDAAIKHDANEWALGA